MKIVTFFFSVLLVNLARSSVASEILLVDQNDLFRMDDEVNPKTKGVCTVHKTTGSWECIMNCVVVVDDDDIQMRQHRFKSCLMARAMVKHMERNRFIAKHINLQFKKKGMSNDE